MTTRILNVVPTLMCGGTENQAITLGRSLDPQKYTLQMACLRRWGQFVDELASSNVLYLRIRSLNSGRTTAEFRVAGAGAAVQAAFADCLVAPPAGQKRTS